MTKIKYPKEVLWVKNKADYLTIYKIEKEIGLPASTLYRFSTDERGLNEQWWPAITEWVKNFKK